jgi:hypothetical protein
MVSYQVWLGRVHLVESIRKGYVRLKDAPADVRGFGHWFTWRPMADTVRAALADGAQRLIGKLRSRCQAGLVRDQYARTCGPQGRLWRGIEEDWG